MKTPLGTEVDICGGHIVLDGFLALRERGTATPPPLLGLCLLWPRSPISATAELLSSRICAINRILYFIPKNQLIFVAGCCSSLHGVGGKCHAVCAVICGRPSVIECPSSRLPGTRNADRHLVFSSLWCISST